MNENNNNYTTPIYVGSEVPYNGMNYNQQNNQYQQYYQQQYLQQNMAKPVEPQESKPQEKPKKKHTFLKVICLILCCAIVGGASGVGSVLYMKKTGQLVSKVEVSNKNQQTSNKNVSSGTVVFEKPQVVSSRSLTCAELFERYSESVLCIRIEKDNGIGSGTGFVVSEDGYILTCYHVVNGAKAISVTFSNSKSYVAEYVGGDEKEDIAIIKIKLSEGDETRFDAITLGDSDSLQVGQSVTTIGNALGTLANTTTTGIVSAKNRAISMADGSVMNLLQTDCAINSGNSGGPLFNEYGEVIGVVNAKYSGTTGSSAQIEGIAFAIPINNVKAIMDDLENYGYITGKPYLGISVSTVSALTAQQYSDYVVGAYVAGVKTGSCAEKAGIQVGDIITQVDDVDITSAAELIDIKNHHKAGENLKLTIFRNKEYLFTVVTLDEENPSTTSAPDNTETVPNNGNNSNSSNNSNNNSYGRNYSGLPFGWEEFFGSLF